MFPPHFVEGVSQLRNGFPSLSVWEKDFVQNLFVCTKYWDPEGVMAIGVQVEPLPHHLTSLALATAPGPSLTLQQVLSGHTGFSVLGLTQAVGGGGLPVRSGLELRPLPSLGPASSFFIRQMRVLDSVPRQLLGAWDVSAVGWNCLRRHKTPFPGPGSLASK